jgi:hypothetical protein
MVCEWITYVFFADYCQQEAGPLGNDKKLVENG